MTEGDVVIVRIPQSDGAIKNRPAVILREMKPFDDFLLCGVSTQLYHEVKDLDEIIDVDDDDFAASGLVSKSLIRVGFLTTAPPHSIMGKIGFISTERHKRLLENLARYLLKNIE